MIDTELMQKMWSEGPFTDYADGIRHRAEGYELRAKQTSDPADFEMAQRIRVTLCALATFACRRILHGGDNV